MKKLLPLAALLCATCVIHAQQNVGIGTNDPKSKLDVKGGIAIGNSYSGVTAAPTDGAIIEGTVGIGTPTPDGKAVLDVNSTTKGMLVPRMTTAQRNAITSPTTGLLIYNTTTNQFNYYNGTAWDVVGAGAGGPPSGTAGGDLTGTYPNPTIATNAVTSSKIADGTVTGTDIANNTIDLTTKVNNVLPVANGGIGVNTVTGIVQGNGSSPVTGISATAGSQYMRRNSANTAYEFGQINYGDVAGTPTGLPPTGAANGDLNGTYPNPTVDGLQNRPVAATAPNTNEVLKWNGTSWAPAADNNGGGTVTSIATGTGLTGGPITGSGTISIANTGVGTGTYNSVTVNAQGQVTAGTVQPYLTGNQAVTLTGDVTGSGTTSIGTTIANNAVNSAKIQDGTVSSADMTATGVGTGTYTKVTVDAAGRVTSAGTLAAGDIPDLSGTYIKNQTAQQAGANFNVAGSGTVGSTMTASTFTFPAPAGDPAPIITTRTIPAGQGNANERTELILFHANDPANGSGDDLITLRAPSIRLQTYNDAAVGDINNNNGSLDRLFVRYDGNIGIGTAAPSTKLHLYDGAVSGAQAANGLTKFLIDAPSGGYTEYRTTADNNTYAGMIMTDNNLGAYVVFRNYSDDKLHIGGYGGITFDVGTDNNVGGKAERARFDANGNLGIGTTAPAYKLQSNGDIYANGGWFRVSGNQGYYFESYGGGWQMLDGTWIRAYNTKPILATGGIAGYGNNGLGTGYNTNPRMYANWDNVNGGGIMIADDGGFFDYNDAWIQFRGSTGLQMRSNATTLMQFGMYNVDGVGVTDKYVTPTNNNFGLLGYSGMQWWYGYAGSGWYIPSRRELKRQVTPVEGSLNDLMMADIDRIRPTFYKLNEETDEFNEEQAAKYRANMHLGIILDEAPDYVQDPTFTGVDMYGLATLALAGVKDNRREVKEIKERLGMDIEQAEVHDFGIASISGNTVTVSFDKDFKGALPVVNVTSTKPGVYLAVTTVTATSFTVESDKALEGMQFNWMAFAKVSIQSKETVRSTGSTGNDIMESIKVNPSIKQRIQNYWLKELPEKLKQEEEKAKREAVAVTEERAKQINNGAKFADPAKGPAKAE